MAKIVSINISTKKGVIKEPISKAELKINHGIVGDAHAGNWHRQISMLAEESIQKMKDKGFDHLKFGDFAENITTEGIEVHTLPVGTKLKIGECEVEVTQIGKKCHNGCAIKQTTGDCVMPREGIFVKVLKEGTIQSNDIIEVL
ncbi:MOSC domain-containing protein [Romboutsia ilealis]|uniref:MOSC domain-containing protein n=1 Tax=Romboutsia faecis TaxID=2764597 RepID=A0ABR7JPS5_9FIRM|nr:MOSC domain-containing protein [Romboutsia faecis]MBC5996916.1 MOSC domain-containing protein [Romboutsia faecis]MRN24582.1 MOSC domain-containing protein [Romboutsia ilealis]